MNARMISNVSLNLKSSIYLIRTNKNAANLSRNFFVRVPFATEMSAMAGSRKKHFPSLKAFLFRTTMRNAKRFSMQLSRTVRAMDLKRATPVNRKENERFRERDFYRYISNLISRKQRAKALEQPLERKDGNIFEMNTSSKTEGDWSLSDTINTWKRKRGTTCLKDSQNRRGFGGGGLFVAAFTLFGSDEEKKDESEDPRDKLLTQIKRSVLLIQQRKYEKAEEMLFIALTTAQEQQSKEGMDYVYDIMANLALERKQYAKAEKLFLDILKRLFSEGYSEESSKVLHISARLAHITQQKGEIERAHQGFVWTLERIKRSLRRNPDDKDMQELYGLTRNWYGQLLMILGKFNEARKHFEAAHVTFTQIFGEISEIAITVLNNLSLACINMEDFSGAKENLLKALAVAEKLKDCHEEGVLYANLGLMYLRQGLNEQAREACSLAFRIGKKQNNFDAIEQAEYCLKEMNSSLKT